MSILRLTAILGGVALLYGGPAMAQQKIAPSRDYSTYTPVPRQGVDRNYGLPSFGSKEANVPQQKTMATGGRVSSEPESPGFLAPSPPAADPGLPGTMRDPGDGQVAGGAGSEPDFFSYSTDFTLPKQAQASGSETDTPLFTTQTPDPDAISGGDSGGD